MRLGLYLGDQVWERTRSKGIYGYSRVLTSELLRRLRDHEWTLIVNRANRADMTPTEGDPRVVALPAACASGVPRLFADQVLATALSRSHRLHLVHFPKGFMPFLRPAPVTTVTLHDTIPLYYARHHPDVLPSIQLRYLLAVMRHTLREASAVVTDSEHSRTELAELAASAGADTSKIEVCAPTPDPDLVRDPPPTEIDRPPRLIHFGSLLPHKRTAETIRAFRAFNAARGGGWTLRVVGLDVPPPGVAAGEDVTFLGPVARDVVRREICDARALLFLSSIEGFGLPALEAWFLGTPVCFTPGGALGEVLERVPGRCETTAPDEVVPALDAILALGPGERARIRDALRTRYGLTAFGRRMAELFGRWMGTSRR